MAGLLASDYYGEDKGRALIENLVSTLKPAPVDGHLALARGVASGEYWIALNNFINLTINDEMTRLADRLLGHRSDCADSRPGRDGCQGAASQVGAARREFSA